MPIPGGGRDPRLEPQRRVVPATTGAELSALGFIPKADLSGDALAAVLTGSLA